MKDLEAESRISPSVLVVAHVVSMVPFPTSRASPLCPPRRQPRFSAVKKLLW